MSFLHIFFGLFSRKTIVTGNETNNNISSAKDIITGAWNAAIGFWDRTTTIPVKTNSSRFMDEITEMVDTIRYPQKAVAKIIYGLIKTFKVTKTVV